MLRRLLRKFKQIAASDNQVISGGSVTFGITTGENPKIGRPRRIEGAQYMKFGDNCQLGANAWISAYDTYGPSKQKFNPQIIFGNNVFIGDYATITCINKVILEDHVEISDFLYISDNLHSITPEEGIPIRDRRLISRGYVKIGAYTGVGINCAILPGVTLGKHCVVGAHSVVTKSFPDYSVIMGNPAVLLKTFDPQTKKWVFPKKEQQQNQEA